MTRPDLLSEKQQIIDTLTLGFSSDPVLRWLYLRSTDYLAHFPTVFRYFGARLLPMTPGSLHKTRNGAALRLPPGAHPDGEALLAHFDKVLPPAQKGDALRTFDIMEATHPQEPCWHLAFIATDPTARGKGHGSALMRQALQRIDAEEAIAYLENTNPANIPFYERHGFQVIGELQAGDVPPMYAMRRNPR